MNLRSFHRHLSAAALALLAVMTVASPANGASSRDKGEAPGEHGRKAAVAHAGTSEDGGPRQDGGGPPAHAGPPADVLAHAGPPADVLAHAGPPADVPADTGDGNGTPADVVASRSDDRPPATRGGGRPDRPGPPGNNGTIKVVMEDTAQHPDNEPHGCLRGIDFYGFDDEQVLDVEFWMHPPTGRDLLFRVEDVVMVNGGNGSEPSRDTLLLVGVTTGMSLSEMLDARLAAMGAERHPQQGYHVKVEAVDQTGRKVKSKVFWHDCPPPPPVGPKTVPPVQPPANVPPPANVQPPQVVVVPNTDVRPTVEVRPTAEVPPAGLATVTERAPEAAAPAAERPTEVKGIEFQRGPLARTGTDPFGLARVGLALTVAGLGAMAGSRLRRREDFVCIAERLSSY